MPKGPQQQVSTLGHNVVSNIKETLEALVVAFILAFVFRAFVLEAFVIPTGSMAVTLYGAQVTNTCSTCGYEYARGIGDEETGASNGPVHAVQLRCSNCDTMVDQIPSSALRQPDSGDRILVLKWAYDLGIPNLGAHRWDITVFKNPSDGLANYIKRLVGLPGEVLEIIDGDVYTAPIADLQRKEPGLIEALDALRQQVARHYDPALRPGSLHGPYPHDRPDLMKMYELLNRRLLPHLQIQHKTKLAQESLWATVYDHDFCPAKQSAGHPLSPVCWKPLDEAARRAWDTSKPEMTFSSDTDTPLAIRLEGKPIQDFVAYNFSQVVGRSDDGAFPVGDLRLRFVWFPDAGDGSITMQMNRDRDTFVAEVRRDGTMSLDHLRNDLPGGKEQIGQARLPQPFAAKRAVSIEFVNVDYRVSLQVDGTEVMASTPQQYAPDLNRGLEVSLQPSLVQPTQVQIAARNLRCRLRHLLLHRDVYYRAVRQNERPPHGPDNPYLEWPGWGTAGCPIMLKPERYVDGQRYYGEYFMLGDNSPVSKDSRRWWEIGPHLTHLGEEFQLGTVPGDQLVGRAFFVYWPAGYRISWIPNIGLVPNFGQIRWIR